jgi:hypothetical protein
LCPFCDIHASYKIATRNGNVGSISTSNKGKVYESIFSLTISLVHGKGIGTVPEILCTTRH